MDSIVSDLIEKTNPAGMALIENGTLKLVSEREDSTGFQPVVPPILAAAVLCLRLDLDTPVGDHIGTDPAVTPRHLLTHTSGIGVAPSLMALVRADRALPERHITVQAVPGTRWCFSDLNHRLLERLIARTSGQSLAAFVHERVLGPLGMDGTRLDPPATTLDDMVTFAAAILESRLDRTLIDDHYRLDPRLPGMGLGFFLTEINGHRVARYDSRAGSLWLAPDDLTAVVVLNDGKPTTLARDLMQQMFVQPGEINRRAATINRNLTGYYAPPPGLLLNLPIWHRYGGGVRIRVRRGRLVLAGQMDPAQTTPLDATDDPLAFRAGDQWLVFDDDRLYLGLHLLHRRPYRESLGGRLLMFIAAVMVVFLLVLILIVL
jgi:CubicO group peptidase (beta-lactamase class C family)